MTPNGGVVTPNFGVVTPNFGVVTPVGVDHDSDQEVVVPGVGS